MKKAELKRVLYLVARSCVAQASQDDVEVVKSMRDDLCLNIIEKPYSKLNESELSEVINRINSTKTSAPAKTEKVSPNLASKSQIDMIRHLGLELAIQYMDWSGWHTKGDDGKYINIGETMKVECAYDYNHGKGLAKNVMTSLYNNWLNPKCHELLIEGEFKKSVRVPARFYYNRLTPSQANYLVQRLQLIHTNTFQRIGSDFINQSVMNN